MDTEEITNKIKDFFTKGAKASKEAFEKAGDKVQEFSDKSVVRLEKKQLENKLDAKYAEMGKALAEILGTAEVKFESAESQSKFEAFTNDVKTLQQQIKEKEDLLK